MKQNAGNAAAIATKMPAACDSLSNWSAVPLCRVKGWLLCRRSCKKDFTEQSIWKTRGHCSSSPFPLYVAKAERSSFLGRPGTLHLDIYCVSKRVSSSIYSFSLKFYNIFFPWVRLCFTALWSVSLAVFFFLIALWCSARKAVCILYF